MIKKSTGSLPVIDGSSGENEAACPVVTASLSSRSLSRRAFALSRIPMSAKRSSCVARGALPRPARLPRAGPHGADEEPQKLREESFRRGSRLREFLDLPGHLQDPVAGLLNAGDVGHADFALERGNGERITLRYLT